MPLPQSWLAYAAPAIHRTALSVRLFALPEGTIHRSIMPDAHIQKSQLSLGNGILEGLPRKCIAHQGGACFHCNHTVSGREIIMRVAAYVESNIKNQIWGGLW